MDILKLVYSTPFNENASCGLSILTKSLIVDLLISLSPFDGTSGMYSYLCDRITTSFVSLMVYSYGSQSTLPILPGSSEPTKDIQVFSVNVEETKVLLAVA